ncbi:hypothetical protein ACFFJX_18705 [Pseudarcicella hirudinis]|uniref:hypothetical protein n=1 Tax=Pseudarcicella hirudinis TaxID=1079859 RepID=UPI0035EF00EA
MSDLQLSDMTGRNYSSRWSQLSANKIRLDLSNLPSGKYLVCVETRQEPIVGTLVVSH